MSTPTRTSRTHTHHSMPQSYVCGPIGRTKRPGYPAPVHSGPHALCTHYGEGHWRDTGIVIRSGSTRGTHCRTRRHYFHGKCVLRLVESRASPPRNRDGGMLRRDGAAPPARGPRLGTGAPRARSRSAAEPEPSHRSGPGARLRPAPAAGTSLNRYADHAPPPLRSCGTDAQPRPRRKVRTFSAAKNTPATQPPPGPRG